MKTYEAVCVGVSELFFGAPLYEKKGKNETHEQFDERTWPLKVNNVGGKCFIQPFAIKNGLESAAKRIGLPVPGQGKATFSKLFRQGILITDRCWLSIDGRQMNLEKDIRPLKLFVPADGKRGSGKRVFRTFPTAGDWAFSATIHVVDPKIDESILESHLVEFGQFIGVGSMRVENGGIAGRFKLESLNLVS